jgi:hypothetical protein
VDDDDEEDAFIGSLDGGADDDDGRASKHLSRSKLTSCRRNGRLCSRRRFRCTSKTIEEAQTS